MVRMTLPLTDETQYSKHPIGDWIFRMCFSQDTPGIEIVKALAQQFGGSFTDNYRTMHEPFLYLNNWFHCIRLTMG